MHDMIIRCIRCDCDETTANARYTGNRAKIYLGSEGKPAARGIIVPMKRIKDSTGILLKNRKRDVTKEMQAAAVQYLSYTPPYINPSVRTAKGLAMVLPQAVWTFLNAMASPIS